MMKRYFAAVPAICFVILMICPAKKAEAGVKVSSFQEFQTACRKEGNEKIEIGKDIAISGPVILRGDKKIVGHGHVLERSKKNGKVYGGSLFLVRGGKCEWEDVTVSGAGKDKNVVGKIFGRLVEVREGSMIIGEKSSFRDNINDRLAVDGGGAIQIGSKGSCIMKAGEIRNNQNVSRGAAFLVEKGGTLFVRGGLIRNNKVKGAGAVKTFDGRGGAVYCEGKVRIEGGRIEGNQAICYRKGNYRYGGMGAAVYAEAGSSLYVGGGVFCSNSDDRSNPFWINGTMKLAGKPVLENIYLSSHVSIQIEKTFFSKKKVTVTPEKYKSGICISKGKISPFQLDNNSLYELKRRNSRCIIMKKEKKKKQKKKKQKKQEPAYIYLKKKELVFYVGEFVDREVMLHGVKATDEDGKDITENVKIIAPESEVLPTEKTGKGEIIYEVKNAKGCRTKKTAVYRIRHNKAPVIYTAPRFLFLSEVREYTQKQWKELLLEGCVLKDDSNKSEELEGSTEVEIGNVCKKKAGKWEAVLKVRDQYGHRYYMSKKEKRRYGKGAVSTAKIVVTLVDYSESEYMQTGYIRRVKPAEADKTEEEWHFTPEEMNKVRSFMDTREDPFAECTNRDFLNAFKECRRYEEDVGE